MPANVRPSKRSGVCTVWPAPRSVSAKPRTQSVSPSAWWRTTTSAMATRTIRTARVGDDRPVAPTLLLHGLSANGGVWAELEDVLRQEWDGSWSAPDLPGHGSAPQLERYTFDALAAAVAAGLDPAEPHVVLGHSLGGVV